ncbi:hypothetical protein HON52_00015 [Candidatus Uhrbacteria bacterium]|jgi:hypothetical protein|nr:hypothetical protein [Candidatus Uhrbacteria bacterium]
MQVLFTLLFGALTAQADAPSRELSEFDRGYLYGARTSAVETCEREARVWMAEMSEIKTAKEQMKELRDTPWWRPLKLREARLKRAKLDMLLKMLIVSVYERETNILRLTLSHQKVDLSEIYVTPKQNMFRDVLDQTADYYGNKNLIGTCR